MVRLILDRSNLRLFKNLQSTKTSLYVYHLAFEKELTTTFDTDKKYSFENRGAVIMKVYSIEFTKAYNAKLNGMVERRMQQSIQAVGSFWYSAWIKAGKPDLENLLSKPISKKLDAEFSRVNAAHKAKKIKGRIHNE